MRERHAFLEFFAGGGMARLGLGPRWRCLLANDMDAQKCAAYRANFGGDDLVEADIAALNADALPQTRADLAWASFPCQDLSLAGARAGLQGARSGAFFQFWRLMEELRAEGRGPRLVALENVAGLLTSNGGADFRAVIETIA
ncbi:MAG: DNA cytosine methyltransferase, partial [Amphiplicatus sp.]